MCAHTHTNSPPGKCVRANYKLICNSIAVSSQTGLSPCVVPSPRPQHSLRKLHLSARSPDKRQKPLHPPSLPWGVREGAISLQSIDSGDMHMTSTCKRSIFLFKNRESRRRSLKVTDLAACDVIHFSYEVLCRCDIIAFPGEIPSASSLTLQGVKLNAHWRLFV